MDALIKKHKVLGSRDSSIASILEDSQKCLESENCMENSRPSNKEPEYMVSKPPRHHQTPQKPKKSRARVHAIVSPPAPAHRMTKDAEVKQKKVLSSRNLNEEEGTTSSHPGWRESLVPSYSSQTEPTIQDASIEDTHILAHQAEADEADALEALENALGETLKESAVGEDECLSNSMIVAPGAEENDMKTVNLSGVAEEDFDQLDARDAGALSDYHTINVVSATDLVNIVRQQDTAGYCAVKCRLCTLI